MGLLDQPPMSEIANAASWKQQTEELYCGMSVPPPAQPPAPFVKHDAGKNRLDLIPVAPLEEIGKVMTWAVESKGYPAGNWRKCASQVRYLGAALRHLFAWARGEDNDGESGLSHLAHAGACCLMLHGLVIDGVAKDDRDRPPNTFTKVIYPH